MEMIIAGSCNQPRFSTGHLKACMCDYCRMLFVSAVRSDGALSATTRLLLVTCLLVLVSRVRVPFSACLCLCESSQDHVFTVAHAPFLTSPLSP